MPTDLEKSSAEQLVDAHEKLQELYRRSVADELQRHQDHIKKLYDATQQHDVKLAVLNVKSGMWGVIGGMLPFLVALVIWMLRRE